MAPAVSHALAANVCAPALKVTGTEKLLLLMIGPYWTPSTHKIMPAMLAPEIDGRADAVTVNPEDNVAPFAGELIVTMSLKVRVPRA